MKIRLLVDLPLNHAYRLIKGRVFTVTSTDGEGTPDFRYFFDDENSAYPHTKMAYAYEVEVVK